jgi:hypothetical protein
MPPSDEISDLIYEPIILMASIMDSQGGITNLTLPLNVSRIKITDKQEFLDKVSSFEINSDN